MTILLSPVRYSRWNNMRHKPVITVTTSRRSISYWNWILFTREKLPPIKSEERTGKFSCCCHSSEVPLRSGIRGIREGLMRHMPMWNADVTGCCIICCMGINRVLFVLAGMKIRIVFFHLSIQLYHFRRNDIIECIKFTLYVNQICFTGSI